MANNRSVTEVLRDVAEAQLLDTSFPPCETVQKDSALLHELQVHQIELEMQNEALRRAQAALEISHDNYVDLFDFAPVAYLTLSPDGRIDEANLVAASELGVDRAELLGQCMDRYISPADLDYWKRHEAAVWQSLESPMKPCELLIQREDGATFPAQLQCRVMARPDTPEIMRIVLFDTTERSAAAAEIQHLAHYDALTQLPNRRLFQDRLGQALAASRRTGMYGAILFLDLDDFKSLNDTNGHSAGDQMLVEIAKRLRSKLREGDTVARIGGDEFVMILEGLDLSEHAAAQLAKQIGDKLNQTIAHRVSFDGGDFHCTTSIGVRMFGPGESVDDLLKQADQALYQAKSAGRNQVRFFDRGS